MQEAITRVRQVTSILPSDDIELEVEVLAPAREHPSVLDLPPRERDPALVQQEIHGCKSLLIEIIRRAAYDWVLYRTSRRMLHKKLAEHAYQWLFVEEEGDAGWQERLDNDKYITSFTAICSALDMDPEKLRALIRVLTPKNVMSVGRPAEYRRREAAPSLPEEAPIAIDGRTLDLFGAEDSGED
jgi:hypothetical protein